MRLLSELGHMWRFDTEVNYLKKAVESGRLGRIIKTKGYGIHENWGPSGWFTQKDLAGGGALADMGVHAIDTVRYILGDPKPQTVYAEHPSLRVDGGIPIWMAPKQEPASSGPVDMAAFSPLFLSSKMKKPGRILRPPDPPNQNIAIKRCTTGKWNILLTV